MVHPAAARRRRGKDHHGHGAGRVHGERPGAGGIVPVAFPAAKQPTGGAGWQWPLKEGAYTLGTKYHQNGNMWSLGYHTGLDLVAPSGTPIYAAADGKIVHAGPGGSYGNETEIQHAGGVISLYAHQTSIKVSVGQTVKRGDQIGTVGATGNVTGPHLHWECGSPGSTTPSSPARTRAPAWSIPRSG